MPNSTLKLLGIKTKNYQNISIGDDGVNFENLNVFIGSNGSGKSNLVNIFRFLKDSIEDVSSEDRGVTSFDDAVSAFGGERMLDFTLKRPANVEFQFKFSPTDIEFEADVKYESVDAGRVLAHMDEAENSLNIIILDACRDNPFARNFRSGLKGLAKMDAPTGSILAYSTAPGSIAADGVGRNGLYTSYLLMNLMTPGLKIEDMFKKIRIGVSKESRKKQIPWESSSLMGDFYFSTKRGLSVVGIPAKKTPSNKVDANLVIKRERLERERRELEQLKMEIERQRLEEERKRLEAEKQKIEVAAIPSVSELKINLKMNRCFNDRSDEYVVQLNGETIWSNFLSEYDGMILTEKLKHATYKLSFISKSGPEEKRVEKTIEFTENRTINIDVTKNHWWCRESLNIH